MTKLTSTRYRCPRHGRWLKLTHLNPTSRKDGSQSSVVTIVYWACPVPGCNFLKPAKYGQGSKRRCH